MTDPTDAPPATPALSVPAAGWQATLWQSFDVVKFLAVGCAAAYVAMLFMGKEPDETLKNVFLMIVAFYFGSSLGSKNKESVMLPPSNQKGP